MIKSLSKIIGTPVLINSIRPATTVKNLILDPDSGKVVAFLVNINRKEIISPIDVQVWHEIIKVGGQEDIIAVDDVVRVKEIIQSGRYFEKAKVYTKKGEYLGRVLDFAVNTKSYCLESIYVAKTFLGLLKYESRIIQYKDIVEVKEAKVVVKTSLRTVKKENPQPMKLEDAIAS